MEDFKLTKKPDLGIFDQQFPARLKEADIYDPTKFTILTGSDGILDDLFSYHVYTRIKNHWRSDVAPADIQPGMIWSDSDDDKLYHHGNVGGAADEEILQVTRSIDVSPYFENLYIAGQIFHTGDVDTHVLLQTDRITLVAGGVSFINAVEAATDYLQLLDGKNFIGGNVNSMMTVGLTINQGANDDEILAFKSSDVAHGMTTLAETDTYVSFAKRSASSGGVTFMGLSEGLEAMNITGVATTDNTTKGAAALAPIRLIVGKKTLLTGGAVGADANLVVIRNWATTVW
ncbi:hypothetical protein KA005_22915, partial [bacterium]|nr:hypothetical protein [bacterium]